MAGSPATRQLRRYCADLHIHTCLSPCGDWEMGPRNIIGQSLKRNLDIIAICDHNTVENAGAVMRAGRREGVAVLPGMEVCSREEVHLLSIFDDLEQAMQMQAFVYDHLEGRNNPELFGHQVVANHIDEVRCENDRLLIGATALSVEEIVDTVKSLEGLCIASHVDKQAFSMIYQLGFIPPDLPLDGIEVSPFGRDDCKNGRYPGAASFPVITASDAHFPADIGKACTFFMIAEPTTRELRKALQESEGRYVEV